MSDHINIPNVVSTNLILYRFAYFLVGIGALLSSLGGFCYY